MEIKREYIILSILAVVLLVLFATYGSQFKNRFTLLENAPTPSPQHVIDTTHNASGTPIYLVEKNNSFSLLIGNHLYRKGDFYFEKNTLVATDTLPSLQKTLLVSVPEKGARSLVLDMASSKNGGLLIFTVRIDPSENEWGTYTTYAYHVTSKTTQRLFSSTDSRDYASTIVQSISSDDGYIAFSKNACSACDGGPFDTLLYELKTGNTENIGPTIEFEWKTNGAFRYKPCDLHHSEEGFGFCANSESSTPFEDDQFSA